MVFTPPKVRLKSFKTDLYLKRDLKPSAPVIYSNHNKSF